MGSRLRRAGYFYTRDHLGSVWAVIANDGATLESEVRYDPWGNIVVLSGVATDSNFGFAGHYTDNPSGALLAQYRGYDPVTARWLSRDPLGGTAGNSIYSYAGNAPTSRTDPDGRQAVPYLDPPYSGPWQPPDPPGPGPWHPPLLPPSPKPSPADEEPIQGEEVSEYCDDQYVRCDSTGKTRKNFRVEGQRVLSVLRAPV